MEPSRGTQITEKIRLEEQIGRGAMGSVWTAHHSGLGTKVAVKLIASDAARKHRVVFHRFEREAALAAKIKSPHVAQIFDSGRTEDGTPYIVMELLEGETLAARIKRTGPLSVADTALLVAQVAEVLGRAHDIGVVHRDIKPSNIMLIESGYQLFVKVLDFGIAKSHDAPAADGLTVNGELMGSPLYMSPEQFADPKTVDGRADLWSLAVMTFEAMTGAICFAGDTLPQVMKAALSRERRTISALRPELSEVFDAFFDKALDPDLDKRFRDAPSLGRAFAAVARLERPSGAPAPLDVPLDRTAPLEDEHMAETVVLPSASPSAPRDDDAGAEPPKQPLPWKIIAAAAAALAAITAVVLTSGGDAATPTAPTAPAATGAAAPESEPSPPQESAPPPEPQERAPQPPEPAASPASASARATASAPAPVAATSAAPRAKPGEVYDDDDLPDPGGSDPYDGLERRKPDIYDDKSLQPDDTYE